MTISTDTASASYTGNGVTQIFPVPFYFLVDTDLKVSKKVAATGVVSVLTLNSDYTVSDAGNQAGGSITTLAVPASGDLIFIERNVDAVQETAYPENGIFPAASHEKALDRLTMLVQQLQTADNYALTRDPLGDSYDVGGSTISNLGTGVNPTDAVTKEQMEAAVAAAAGGISPDTVATKSDLANYAANADLASGASGKGTDRLGFVDALAPTYLKTLSDIINGERVSVLRAIDPAKWAAIRAGTDTSDLAPAINALLTAMGTAGHGHLYFPAGCYGLGAELTVPSNVTIEGVRGKSWLFPVYDPVGGNLLLSTSGKSFVTIRGMGFDGKMATRGVSNFVNVVTIYQSSDVVLEDCNWKDCKGIAAIFSSDVARSGVRRGNFSNCGTYNLTSLLDADRRQGIAFTSGTQANNLFNFVEDTTLQDIGLDCISIGNQVHFTAQRNRINRNYAGMVYVSGSDYVNVQGNQLVNAGGNAIDVNGGSHGTYSNNTILNPGGAGVMLAGALSGATVSGNVIRGALSAPASLHKGAITLDPTAGTLNNVTITGNNCTSNNGWGFYVRSGSYSCGAVHLDASTNNFTSNTLGDISGLDTAYLGGVGQKIRTVAAGASIVLMPAVGAAVANFAIIEVLRTADSKFGRFLTRGTSAVAELEDAGAAYDTTDTGTSTAIFYDSTSGNILLKNKSAGSQSFAISIRGMGAI